MKKEHFTKKSDRQCLKCKAYLKANIVNRKQQVTRCYSCWQKEKGEQCKEPK